MERFSIKHVSDHSRPVSHLRTLFCTAIYEENAFWAVGIFLFCCSTWIGHWEELAQPYASLESSTIIHLVPMFQLDMYQAGMSNKVRTEGLLNAQTSTAAA